MLLARCSSTTEENHDSGRGENGRNWEASAFLYRWNFKISKVDIIDDEADENMVVSCECRGTTISTGPFSSTSRARLHTELTFDTVLHIKSTLLAKPIETTSGSTPGEGTRKTSPAMSVESFVVRIAVRANTSTGELIDCMALDLSTLIGGGESEKEHKLELQMGGVIHTRVVCRRLGRVDAHRSIVEDDLHPWGGMPQGNERNGRFDRLASAASAESLSEERVGNYLGTFQSLSLEGDDDSEIDGRGKRDLSDKPCLTPEQRMSLTSITSDQNQSSFDEDANSDCANSFTLDSSSEIHRDLSSIDLQYDGRVPPSDEGHKISTSTASGTDEGDGSIQNRTVITTHPFTSLVTARYSHENYYLRAEIPLSERPITTHVRSPKPLVIWSVQGPEQDDDSDSDSEMEDLGDGTEVPKRNIEKLQAAWRYLDCPGKCGLPAGAGKLSALQQSKCWYAQRESPACIVLKRPSTTFGRKTTALRAAAESSETDIEVCEPFLSDSDSDNSSNADDDGFCGADMACEEEFVQDWGAGQGSVQSEVSSTPSDDNDERGASDSGPKVFEQLDTSRDSDFCLRLEKLRQRISTLSEDRGTVLQQLRSVSLESDRLEAECQDLRTKLKFAGESEQIQLESENQNGTVLNHMLFRTMRLKLAGELKLRQLSNQEQSERQGLLAKAAELEKLEKEKSGSSCRVLAHEQERLQKVIESLQDEISSHHGIQEHLRELGASKSDLAVARAENERLQLDIAKARAARESSRNPWKVFAR